MKHKNIAYIDKNALISNYKTIDGITGNSRVICVVKADAYGHGIEYAASALGDAGCDFFAVSSEEEAAELRAIENANARHPDILILGHIDPENVGEMISHDITCTVVSAENARLLSDAAKVCGGVLKIHIKLDTGMNRLGFSASDSDYENTVSAIADIAADENLALGGIFTHFSSADDELMDGRILPGYESVGGYTRLQLSRYIRVINALRGRGINQGICHAANSAAILTLPEAHFDAVRAGVILYGMMPNGSIDERFKPVMKFESSVTHIHVIRAGEKVSYGAEFEAENDIIAATVAAGYADGFERSCKGCYVTIGGRKYRQIGRICMDQFMVDVTDSFSPGAVPVKVGDAVTLFGGDDGQSANALARLSGSINYEVLCRVSKRVLRKLV